MGSQWRHVESEETFSFGSTENILAGSAENAQDDNSS